MSRNFDLELRLVTPSVNSASNAPNHSTPTMESASTVNQEGKQHLTVFYNGTVASCDVTELQARAIISLASNRESDARNRIVRTPLSNRSSPVVTNSPIYSPMASTALSMKKSLQRFLEKRKARAQATAPYSITRLNKPY